MKRNKKLTKEELDIANEVYLLDNQEFDYTQEIYDLNDVSLMKSRHNSVHLKRSENKAYVPPEADTTTAAAAVQFDDVESGLLSEAVAMIDRQDRLEDNGEGSPVMTPTTYQRRNEKEKRENWPPNLFDCSTLHGRLLTGP